jgi:UDP-GlcNAc3NAcA epimerase
MKVLSIIGARPQFIKAAVVNRAIQKNDNINNIIVHTGQHYDKNMSEQFFLELEIEKPHYNLNVGSGSHATQTGLMLQKIEAVLTKENPDWVLIYGDTNTTIAGALAASKMHIRIAHIEAGLRSFNRYMPEEINRIVSDHISSLLFAPTRNAMINLEKEGLKNRSVLSGDVMYDSILYYSKHIDKYSDTFLTFNFPFYLATVHRQENTDDQKKLLNIFKAFAHLDKNVILPLHPRTKKQLKTYTIKISPNIHLIEPIGYLNTIYLLQRCEKVLTDSGGLQKEAYFLKRPCISLREETEWVETLEGNWNLLAGTDIDKILNYAMEQNFSDQELSFGDGNAGELIVNSIFTNNECPL